MAERGGLDAPAAVVALARLLRDAGVPATTQRAGGAVEAVQLLDPARRDHVYWAGRITLCAGPMDIDRYDELFGAVFDRTGSIDAAEMQLRLVEAVAGTSRDGDGGDDEEAGATAASSAEVLRHRDIASLTPADRVLLARLLARQSLPAGRRRSRRLRPAPVGATDPARTLRTMLRDGGELHRLAYRTRVPRPRRLVLLVDVSGSMAPYADTLLRFAHTAARRPAGPPAEIFTLGTRLTRVSREMRVRDPDAALLAAAEQIPDWSGGTRLGVLVKEFLDEWGQRGTARGAVVVVMSDGWERGDVTLLGEQMARLRRLAHRVIWANPRAGRPGFTPVAAGMAAALPHVDDLVAGHSLSALERLADLVAGAADRGSRRA